MAAQLNKLGHKVTVYERDEAPGGLLRFGVPDAKLEKWIIDRRVTLLEQEGIDFVCDTDVGGDVEAEELRRRHDAVVIAIGSRVHRDLETPGRELANVHFAMDYLYQRNRWVARSQGRPARETPPEATISAEGRRVVVVGGGDTGMDCVSNALREGAESVLMLDVYPPLPKEGRMASTPWPLPPKRTRTTYALDEGGDRRFGTEVIELLGDDGNVSAVRGWRVEGTSSRDLKPVPGSEFEEEAQLVLIAIGFSHPEHEGAVAELGLDLDARGNVKAPVYGTKVQGVFACGDARTGQSLVVTAIAEGRRCARVVDQFLGGTGEARRIPAQGMFAYEDGDPELAAPPGRDRPDRHGRRRLLVRSPGRALGTEWPRRRKRSSAAGPNAGTGASWRPLSTSACIPRWNGFRSPWRAPASTATTGSGSGRSSCSAIGRCSRCTWRIRARSRTRPPSRSGTGGPAPAAAASRSSASTPPG